MLQRIEKARLGHRQGLLFILAAVCGAIVLLVALGNSCKPSDTSASASPANTPPASSATTKNKADASPLVILARKSNESWLLRYPKSLKYNVTYTFSYEIPAEKERPLQTFKQTYKTVYDRGIDFYPPSELCLYKQNKTLPEVLTFTSEDQFRVLRYPVKDYPNFPFGMPGVLAEIARNSGLSDALSLLPTIGKMESDILLNAKTGNVLREVCLIGVSAENGTAVACTIWDYVYRDNAKYPETVVLYSYDAISEPVKIALPATTADWKKQSDELLKKADKRCTITCAMVKGLYFAVAYKQEATGEAKQMNAKLSSSRLSNISFTENTGQIPLPLTNWVNGGSWAYSHGR